uniref:Uncharacterized protein n=1 Tax=Rhizophagus irregularis (strain DAOM 181602 / DAOM 197198 / MUCL 43194) TaxID=747089 RepID=U9T485_RHIID
MLHFDTDVELRDQRFTWIFHNKFSFGLSYTLANKRWSFLWTSGWIYNLCEENDQLYEVSFFKTVDYDLDKYERSTKYKNANISCFECYDKVYSHKKEYPTMIGACGGNLRIVILYYVWNVIKILIDL